MKKFEIVIETPHETARSALAEQAAFVKRSQVEDAFFENGRGDVARLRRQDTVSRLSCTRPIGSLSEERPETIVIDFAACAKLLARFGFREVARERYVRETWKKHHYALHLDRFPSLPARLTLEAEAWASSENRMKRQAVRFLKSMGISVKIGAFKADIDKPKALPYTAPIKEVIPATEPVNV